MIRIDPRTCIMSAATILSLAAALSLPAFIDLKNPAVTLYERPPATTKPSPKNEPERLPEIRQSTDGYWHVGFEHLASFSFPEPEADAPQTPGSVEKIPANVSVLNGKQVCVSGFMLPIKVEHGVTTEFLIIRSPMVCCYGVVPKINEWVLVTMKTQGAPAVMDVPLDFFGTLHVGERYDHKMLVGLYQLEGEKVTPRR